MTLAEFDEKPREDWDFCDLWDELRAALGERDELRARLEKELLGVYRQRDELRSQVALLRQEIARLEALNAALRRQVEERE